MTGAPGERVAVLSGPNLAREIMAEQPAAATIACPDEEAARRFQTACHTPYVRHSQGEEAWRIGPACPSRGQRPHGGCGDCLADVAILRAEPALFGPVACGPTVSRLIDALAAAGSRALAAIRTARAEVREHIWQLTGTGAPHADGQVIVDIDGVLVLAHSGKEDATRTWKKTYGRHPLMAFVDHGRGGT